MYEKELKQAFSQRVRKNYENFLKGWLQKEPEDLVSCAEEIVATKILLKALPEVAGVDDMEYLMRFENPLEIVRDGWMSMDSAELGDELRYALLMVGNDQSIWENYALTDNTTPSNEEGKATTVREFIRQHPQNSFNMMTPGGYVYLSPEKAKLLLEGQSTAGHPGSAEYAMEITANELLDQEVINSNFSEGTWHILSGYAQEMEQTSLEKGVTMC